MLTLKLAMPFAFSIFLFAESANDQLGSWGQLTALGVVAVVLIFIVTRMLPSIHEQFVRQSEVFAAAMAKAQSDFAESAAAIAKQQHEDSVKMNESVSALREHCAAARLVLEGRKNA